MAAGYTYEIRLRDLMSKGFAKAAQASTKFHSKVIADSSKFRANLQRIPKRITAIKTRLNNLKNEGGNTFSKLTRLSGGFLIGLAAFGAAKGIISLGADLEQTRVSFQTMLQSVDKGNQMLLDLNEFSNSTPFANSDIQDAAKTLLNFGITGEKIIPTIKRIGDVSGGNKEKLKGLTLAFAQVSSAGKLQGQDLLQMINAGFNPLQEISRTTGKSMATLKDEMSRGAITAGMVENAFKTVTSEGGMFHNMMEKQSQTLGGKWSTLVGKFKDRFARIGEGMTPVLSRVVDFFIEIVDKSQPIFDAFSSIYNAITPLFSALGGLFTSLGFVSEGATAAEGVVGLFSGALNGLASFINILVTGITSIIDLFTALPQPIQIGIAVITGITIAWKVFKAALRANPIITIIMLIVTLIGWVVTAVKKYEGWGRSFKAIGTIMKVSAKLMWNAIKHSFVNIGFAIKKLWLRFKQLGQWIKGLFMNIGKSIKLALSFDFSGAKKALTAPIKTAATQEIADLETEKSRSNKAHLDRQSALKAQIKHAKSQIGLKKVVEESPEEKSKKAANAAKAEALKAGANVPGSSNTPNSGNGSPTAESIATGGKKTTILNVNIEKVLEMGDQVITEGKEQAEDMIDTIIDGLTRRLHGTFNAVGQ